MADEDVKITSKQEEVLYVKTDDKEKLVKKEVEVQDNEVVKDKTTIIEKEKDKEPVKKVIEGKSSKKIKLKKFD